MVDITTWIQENQLIAVAIVIAVVIALYKLNKSWKQKRALKSQERSPQSPNSRISSLLEQAPAPDQKRLQTTKQPEVPQPNPPPYHASYEIDDDQTFLQKELSTLTPVKSQLEDERHRLRTKITELQSKDAHLETRLSTVNKRIKHCQDQLSQDRPLY